MQNLQLLLRIPDLATFDAQTAVLWHLFDRQSVLLREGSGPLLPTGNLPLADRTVLVIPARRVVYIETPLPPLSDQKRDALLRYAIEDKLTIDPVTVHAVAIGRSASADTNAHVVAAIDRAWLAGVLRWLNGANIAPVQAVSAATLIPVVADEWGVVIEGASGLARRPDGFAYSFDVTSGSDGVDDPGTREVIPMEPPFGLSLALKEAREHRTSPSRITVFVDHAAGTPWIDAWQRGLDCKVTAVVRPPTRMVAADAGNLLSGDFAPRSSHREWLGWLKPAAGLVGVIAILQLSFTVIDAWRLDQRRRALEGEMTRVFKAAFPNAQAIVDPALQMQRNLDTMKRERGRGPADAAQDSLARLTSILAVAPGLVPNRIVVRDGVATVEATVPDRALQAALQSRAASVSGSTFSAGAGDTVSVSMKTAR